MSWWLLGPLLYILGGFITLTAIFAIDDDARREFSVTRAFDDAGLVILVWPVIALYGASYGTKWLLLQGAHRAAGWLRDALK